MQKRCSGIRSTFKQVDKNCHTYGRHETNTLKECSGIDLDVDSLEVMLQFCFFNNTIREIRRELTMCLQE